MKDFNCFINGIERYIHARSYREAAKRAAWGYVQGKTQMLEYVVNVKVVLDEEREFRVRISIYPHFDIHESGCNTFVEKLANF